MITLFNRLLQTEKRRICILFCAGCFCAAVFAFANARLGYLLRPAAASRMCWR